MTNTIVAIFLLTAVATGADPQYKAGERHALVAFIRGVTREDAENRLPEVLSENGWRDWIVEKSGLASATSEKDEGVRLARVKGASITVFSVPVPKN